MTKLRLRGAAPGTCLGCGRGSGHGSFRLRSPSASGVTFSAVGLASSVGPAAAAGCVAAATANSTALALGEQRLLEVERATHVAGGDAVGVFHVVLAAPHGGMHDAHHADEHRGQKVDRDGAGPARYEIACIANDGLRRGERHKAALGYPGLREYLACGIRQRLGLSLDRGAYRRHHLVLPADEVARRSVRHRSDEADGKVGCGAHDGGRDRCLLQRGDDAGELDRFGRELVRTLRDRAGRGDQGAHGGEMRLAFGEAVLDGFARSLDGRLEFLHLRRHLAEQLHDAARARRAGQRAGVLLVRGKPGEALAGALDVGEQRQRAERVAVRLVEIGGVVFERDGEMLLDRGGAGESRRVEPGRHGDDHRASRLS